MPSVSYQDFVVFRASDARSLVEAQLGDFHRQIARLQGAGMENLVRAFREYVFEIFRRIQLRTPVDTGRARRSWHVVPPGTPADSFSYTDDRGTVFDGTLDSVSTGPNEWVVGSNVPYMIALEAGHSRQSPQGMVAITIAEFNYALQAKLEQLLEEMGGDG